MIESFDYFCLDGELNAEGWFYWSKVDRKIDEK